MLAETLVDGDTGEVLVERGTVLDKTVLEQLAPAFANGLNTSVWEPSADGMIKEPVVLQTVKVVSPHDPEKVFFGVKT